MGNWFRQGWNGFVAQAHALGALYYAWAILSGIGTAAYTGYKQLSTPQIQGNTEWFFWVFAVAVVLVLLIGPILVAVIIKSATKNGTNKQVANPTLGITKRLVVYEITPISVTKKQQLTLQALEKTQHFRFHVAVTGIGTTKVALTCPGVTLLGPVERGNGDSYEVQFLNPLQKGQFSTISFDIEVSDPSKTMRCFLADRFHNAAFYGSFDVKYLFNPRPTSILKERQSIFGETLESSNQLHSRSTQAGFEYAYSIAKIDADCIYSVSWVW
jgi:hypothetical protein